MIAYLKGFITYKTPTEIHLEVNGVGYRIFISLFTYTKIQNLKEVILFTHLQIKEDAHTLFGFYDKNEKEMFLNLISISGVGASTARLMLSSLSPSDIYKTITQNKLNILEGIKGIGKKTAERIILELKDKLLKQKSNIQNDENITFNNSESTLNIENIEKTSNDINSFDLRNDTLLALISLGINKAQAEQAVNKVMQKQNDINSVEILIRESLKILSS